MSMPYMTLYVGDYLADTRHLSTEESGAYLHLLFSMWLGGGYIPSDERSLAKLAGLSLRRWRRVRMHVEPMLAREGDLMTQRRLLSELQKADDKYEKKIAAGKASVKAKALKAKQMGATGVDGALEHTVDNQNQNQNQSQNYHQVDLASAAPPPSKPKAVRGTRWPDGQPVPRGWLSIVRQRMTEKGRPVPDLELEAEKFASFWSAKAGQGATKVNWLETFYNWSMNAHVQRGHVSNCRNTGFDAMAAGAMRAIARLEGREAGNGMEGDAASAEHLALAYRS